jgi:hypothetical protein
MDVGANAGKRTQIVTPGNTKASLMLAYTVDHFLKGIMAGTGG